MQGTILILDGVSTNRIMLKVQLSAAWYHVVQADGLAGLGALVRRTRPDLIVTALSLPDGSALDLRARLAAAPGGAAGDIPIIAITPQNDRRARIAALAAGLDEVLAQPVDDLLLQARIRSLIRSRSLTDELRPRGSTAQPAGMGEAAAEFAPLAGATVAPSPPPAACNVALVTHGAETGARWRARLGGKVAHRLRDYRMHDVQMLTDQPMPDAIVMELPTGEAGAGLRLLADLRARGATRHAAIIAIPAPADPHLAAEALDRGAHDVLQGGFCADELALRLSRQLARKARSDQMRDRVRDGLRAAVRDPMTGLFNRRYALPRLAQIARRAAATGRGFAIMLADLDHFKRINDRFGHPAGDAVLVETARRLGRALRPDDLIARIGGEEFIIALPDTGRRAAMRAADRLCRDIAATGFAIPGRDRPVHVTISIGVVHARPETCRPALQPCATGEQMVRTLIGQADRALYGAKDAGRNRFSLLPPPSGAGSGVAAHP